MPTEKPQYTITVDDELLKKIDDFRFDNHFPNRNQAVLTLIKMGFDEIEKEQKEKEGK